MNKTDSMISFNDIATYPQPGNAFPGNFKFTPDDRLVIFLDPVESSLVKQLVCMDTQTSQRKVLVTPSEHTITEDNLSAEEKMRRERQRQLSLGITSYQWSDQTQQILLQFPDGIYSLRLDDFTNTADSWQSLKKEVSNEGEPLIDARFSPDGRMISYVRGGDVCISHSHNNKNEQLTFKPGKEITNGLAEYIAQEEMGRSQGYWWSPDSRMLAFEQVDESNIPLYPIVHQGKDSTGEAAQEVHHYPFAGGVNARVRLGVVLIDTREVVWMDLGSDPDIYLARVYWLPDGRLLAAIMNRRQSKLDLVSFDPLTGIPTQVLSEESAVWINLHDLFRAIKKGPYAGSFIWGSERTGFMHLYLVDSTGKIIRALTAGPWMVDSLDGIDEDNGIVYFTAGIDSPLEAHLYAVLLDGGEPRRITQNPGIHSVTLDQACRRFIDVHQSIMQPPRVTLRSIDDGSEILLVHESQDARLDRLNLIPPELVTLTNRHNDLLYGAIYHPPASFGTGPHPLIVSVYGGPHSQQVCNTWRMTANLRAQALARTGYLVFILDNRGSARRGLAFEGWIKNRLGNVEVDDQVDGVNWLVTQGLADPARVGIYGWSYGGYMALMCLARAPQVFHCAVAGAPVVHWDGYDTCYTERYMGLPQENSEGYQDSSVIAHVNRMTGKLLLVHGLIDENVHFRHTARLINALIKARKPYDLLLFPDERHSPRHLADRVYMEEHITRFFEVSLAR